MVFDDELRAAVQTADPVTQAEEIQLEQVYSRGLGAHFIGGTNHQTVVTGHSPRHRGVLCERVSQVHADHVVVEPTHVHDVAPLKAGDGVVFDAADWRSPEVDEEGGRLYVVKPIGKRLVLHFGNGAITFERIRPGDWVWRTHDATIDKVSKRFTQASKPVYTQPLNVHVVAQEGQALALTWQVAKQPHISVTVMSEEPLGRARNRGVTADYLYKQLGRLGNTAHHLEGITMELDGEPFIPNSLLNRLRQQAVAALVELQMQPPTTPTNAPLAVLEKALAEHNQLPVEPQTTPEVHLLIRQPDQLDAALALRPASITLDYLDLHGLRPSVEKIKAANIVVRVASPRILKPQEQRIVNFLLRLDCPLVVRSSGLLEALQGRHQHALIGDFSLNAANQLSAQTYLELGLDKLTPTHDLNAAQITQLAQAIGGQHLEVIAYHHLPVFHTEHCVFCRFLSGGTSYRDCGQPCETHRIALRDTHGREHPVMADVGCRNTVFGAEAQVASRHIDQMLASGIRHYRLEFVHETPDQVTHVTTAFRRYFEDELSAKDLEKSLKRVAPQGTTEGSFFVPLAAIKPAQSIDIMAI